MANRGLQMSYWLVSWRPVLRKSALVAFCVFDLVILVTVTAQAIRYTASSARHESLLADLATNRVAYAAANLRLRPQPITVVQAAVVGGENGRYDLVAIVRNPDIRWAVLDADYTFVIDDQEVANGSVSFLPGEERSLADFDVPVARLRPQSVPSVIFGNFRLRRIHGERDLPDIKLAATNPAYRILSSVPGNTVSQVTGTVVNGSVFALDEVETTAVLFSGSAIVGAGRLLLTNVAALEERPVDLRLFTSPAVSRVLLRAAVDLGAVVGESNDT